MVELMVSDQLDDWSDKEQESRRVAKKTSPARPSAVAARSCTPWLSYRAIQAMRKARLPLCEWPRTRPEVLPVDQSFRSSTRDALCPTKLSGTSRAVPERLSEGSRDPERDNEHQPRALEATGALVERRHAAYGRRARCNGHRLWRSGRAAGQHARGGVARTEYCEHESGGVP